MKIVLQCLLASILVLGVTTQTHESWAQPVEETSTQNSQMRLITLGTRSGPRPTVGRAQSSNILIINEKLYLVDAGPGVTRRLTRAGIRVADVGKIFISHGHDDHTGGLAALMTTEYSFGRTEPIDIYGPPGTEALIKGMIQFLTVSSEIRMSDGYKTVPIAQILNSHEPGTGTIYQDENVTVRAVENSHFNFPLGSPAYGKYQSYSYRFETPDKVIVFTGDTGPSNAVTELANGADLLVSEVTWASVDEIRERRVQDGTWDTMTPVEQTGYLRHMIEEHLTQEEVGKMASRAGVKTVLLTHVPNSGDPNDRYERFREEVEKYFSGEVLVAEDLKEY